jgi:hypothetical protein
MEKISSILSATTTKLDGEVESDEFYVKAGLKGRSYHTGIQKSGRKPRKRGLKPWRGIEVHITRTTPDDYLHSPKRWNDIF